MKKTGFTLAEVLIALGLVGVIASITIPTFVTNCRQQANEAKFSSTVADMENAFGNMIVNELGDDFTDTKFYSNITKANLEKYLKVIGTVSAPSYKSGVACNTELSFNSTNFEVKSGAYILMVSNKLAYIDANGKSQPNCLNKDLFKVTIDENGFITKQ